eukprot:390866-Prorocentrum_minimum.AAC.3
MGRLADIGSVGRVEPLHRRGATHKCNARSRLTGKARRINVTLVGGAAGPDSGPDELQRRIGRRVALVEVGKMPAIQSRLYLLTF